MLGLGYQQSASCRAKRQNPPHSCNHSPPPNVFGSVGFAERRQSLRTRRGVCIKPSHGFRLNPSATVPYTMNKKPHVRQYNEARAICASGLSPTRSNARAETEGSKGAGKVIHWLDLCVCEVRRQSPTRTPDTFGAHAVNRTCSLLQLQITCRAVREATCGIACRQLRLSSRGDTEREFFFFVPSARMLMHMLSGSVALPCLYSVCLPASLSSLRLLANTNTITQPSEPQHPLTTQARVLHS